jgi:fructose-1,6-bisphosphatase/inositol monophosphatase family enzyme
MVPIAIRCALLWGTLIALTRRGAPVLGLVDAPAMGERWSALQGCAAQFHGRDGAAVRCRASGCAGLAQARLCLPAPDVFTVAQANAVRDLSRAVRLRRYGGDCYAYGLLAAGHLDLIVETGLDDHDFLPLVPLVEAAGGVISDWQGRALRGDSAGDVVAAAGVALHRQALDRLAAER